MCGRLQMWRPLAHLCSYTSRQINLQYRMFFANFSVNSQPIFIFQGLYIFKSRGNYREIFIGKYCIAKKLDHLACRLKTNNNLTSLMGL